MDLLDDQIINLGTITQKESYSLIVQALSANATYEKNKLINETKNPWKMHNQCLQQLNSWNKEMMDTLSKLENKYNTKAQEFNTLLVNTSFQKEFQKRSFTLKDKSDQIAAIKNIENEIQKFVPLQSQSIIDTITDLDARSFLKLKDMTFKRLEELSYALKKRSITYDENENVSNEISTKYGNLKNLLQLYEDLIINNQELKKEELSFIHDSLVKRRNTSQLPKSWLSSIILILQSELSSQNSVSGSLPIKSNVNNNNQNFLNFDSLCTLFSHDIVYAKSDFPITISKDVINNILMASSPQEQLDALRNVIKEQENTIQHLSEELDTLRERQHSENETFITQEREQRLWSLHDKLQKQILDLQIKIDETNNESTNIYNKIIMAIKQKQLYGKMEGEWIHKYQSLQNDHEILKDMVLNNEAICATLYDLSNSFGISLMNKSNSENSMNEMNEYLSNKLNAYLSSQSEVNLHEPSPPKVPVDNENEDDQMKKMKSIRSILLSKKLKKRNSERKDRAVSATLSRKSNRKKQPETEINSILSSNPIEKATKVEIFDYLSLIADIESEIKGTTTSYHQYISGKLHYFLGELRSHYYYEMHNYIEGMKKNINDIYKCSDPLLRVTRRDLEIMVDTEPKIECEVQTEEEEEKGKKKGKNAIKQPTKVKAKEGARKLKK